MIDYKLELLELQRSALIDIQTILQLLVDKGICNGTDIIETRARIETSSPEVQRLNDEIISSGGQIPAIPEVPATLSNNERLKELRDLLQQLSINGGTQP